ncbi:MAG: transporter [Anderseniella sp.]
MPGPGSYFANDLYIYNGTATADLPLGGQVAADVEATAIIDLMTGLHVLPVQFLGGTIAVGLTVPVGWQEISASLGGPGVKDDDFEVGDPVLVGALGWHDGNFHWQIGGLLNVPIGSWNDGDLVNLGFNRWAFDLTGAVTYLGLAAGIELSTAVGVTFNSENLDTGYDSGTEFHAEFAASKLFANGMSLGVVGYHYQQLSGDSGGTAAQQILVALTDGSRAVPLPSALRSA